jgi:hypothetical protein
MSMVRLRLTYILHRNLFAVCIILIVPPNTLATFFSIALRSLLFILRMFS